MTVSGSRHAYWVVFFCLLWFAVATEPNEDQECECPTSVPLNSDPPDAQDYPIFIPSTNTTITYLSALIVWVNGHKSDCEEPIAETCIPPCICTCTVLETRWTPGDNMVTCWETDAKCKEVQPKCGPGLPGILTGNVCCSSDCGTCGGAGCGGRPGGPDNCCSGTIMNSGMMCSDTQAAPCIVDNESMCDNGLPGIQNGDICCDADCGRCGGSGCSKLPGGSASCCSGTIRASGMLCDITNEAPCIVNEPADSPTATPTSPPTPDPTEEPTVDPTDSPVPGCSNGLPGVQRGLICCEAQCGICGGAGCGALPGGRDGCCSGAIGTTGTPCSIAMAAPCIVDN